jgi:hypothetical protein
MSAEIINIAEKAYLPSNPPVQLALRTRVCLMAAALYSAVDFETVDAAAEKALDLEHAVDELLERTKERKKQ